ncbi:hypothetical protein JHK85_051321 [Glycine max]|nr:hypothetical protein JHK85_051321 [Glycine max]
MAMIGFSPSGLVRKFVFLIVVHLAGENQLGAIFLDSTRGNFPWHPKSCSICCSLMLLCHQGPHVSKANTNGNDADVAPKFSPLKTVQFGNPSQDIVDPRDGGFGGRL